MKEMMNNYKQFHSIELRRFVIENYSKDSVAIVLDELYQRVIKIKYGC
jgi:hypothetical protein